MFNDSYKKKQVLITGHTGFKGSWLAHWLLRLGSEVTGVSIDVPTEPSHFRLTDLGHLVDDRRLDIRDRHGVIALLKEIKPDFVFHLAAQALVWRSYSNPADTFDVNIQGTVNMLEGLRLLDHPCTAVFITSDKCYENMEWIWGYRETDRLGGKDPYSASKGGAELAIRGYYASYFSSPDSPIRIAIGRAGNVIGGGDWAENRIVPDCIMAWANGESVQIRNPLSTRPWQHVLEPLSGYLTLGMHLLNDNHLNGEAFNFGPAPDQNYTVEKLIETMSNHWPESSWHKISRDNDLHEAGLLKLDCEKAKALLSWKSTLDFRETVQFTIDWYKEGVHLNKSMLPVTLSQLEDFEKIAFRKNNVWAR